MTGGQFKVFGQFLAENLKSELLNYEKIERANTSSSKNKGSLDTLANNDYLAHHAAVAGSLSRMI